MFCCAKCVNDQFLETMFFNDGLIARVGDCSYCGNSDIKVIEPNVMRAEFSALADLYFSEESGAGSDFVDLLTKDWNLFSELEPHKARALLSNILGKDYPTNPVFREDSLDSHNIKVWKRFSDEIVNENRWFNTSFDDLKQGLIKFADRFSCSVGGNNGGKWYRARIGEIHNFEGLGAPPPEMASSGRINPVGIPYLYLSNTIEACMAEVRAVPGNIVSIGSFNLNRKRVVNLVDPRDYVSPFGIGEAEEISELVPVVCFLEHLAKAFSQPINPDITGRSYIQFQYICEFFKSLKLDGVWFSSSLADGVNLTLFNPANIYPYSLHHYRITSVFLGHDKHYPQPF
ncbi:hypothetical protein CRD20_00610 [Corynebacterium sp. LK33]|nr:hypothetical protein [Corynebacterium sp. LK33]